MREWWCSDSFCCITLFTLEYTRTNVCIFGNRRVQYTYYHFYWERTDLLFSGVVEYVMNATI
ncbi:hypothetical protein MM817_01939 [Acidibacillus sp. S0AB]|uniref:Uncharacterized protein n=1 Tax=Sulfoacidibacillus ferrooxidans TaxID=2005001 RepID=A0A9X2AF35_9BACL|nr:hypothetical protein [Sulfoacidibacillus ferrooxidans]